MAFRVQGFPFELRDIELAIWLSVKVLASCG